MSKQAEHAIEHMFMLERSMLKQICDSKQPPTPMQRLRLAGIVDDAFKDGIAKMEEQLQRLVSELRGEKEVGL